MHERPGDGLVEVYTIDACSRGEMADTIDTPWSVWMSLLMIPLPTLTTLVGE